MEDDAKDQEAQVEAPKPVLLPLYADTDPFDALPPIDPEQFSGPDRTKQAKALFLTAFRRCRVISRAARAADVSRKQAYEWHKTDPAFVEAAKTAEREYVETLENECYDRAIHGIKTLKFDRDGQPTCWYRDKGMASSKLNLETVTAEKPGKFKHRIEAGEMKQLQAEFIREIARLSGRVVEADSVKVLEPARISDSWDPGEESSVPLLEEAKDEDGSGEAA
jgi:hypothetical protein